MSHSEEGENYWPGYVDALTSMVQVLAFVMMMLAMAVFVLSQSVSKHAVETIAEAVKADVKPNSNMKQITQAVLDKLQSMASAGPPNPANSGSPPGESPAAKPAQADPATDPSPEKLTGMRIDAIRARNNSAAAPAPSDAPRITIGFEERGFKLDQEKAQLVGRFIEDNKVVERSAVLEINAYAYSGDGALSEARRLAYYRAMLARKQLVDTKVKADGVRVTVTDTADKDKGSTIEIVVINNSGAH
jgi:hypothetical protein